jgi:hypothetical protein
MRTLPSSPLMWRLLIAPMLWDLRARRMSISSYFHAIFSYTSCLDPGGHDRPHRWAFLLSHSVLEQVSPLPTSVTTVLKIHLWFHH